MTAAERNLRKRVREFDLISLLRLLAHLGYGLDEIVFVSRSSMLSQETLIHDLEFRAAPERQARIIVNWGLLSGQSPLPSYFRKRIDAGGFDGRAFVEFIGYFDHLLIHNFVEQLYPELNPRLFPDWEGAKRRYLLLLNLRSPATLDWLFRLVFPELDVLVEKGKLARGLATPAVKLGQIRLGSDAVLGERARVRVPGVQVTLFCDAERDNRGEPWPREVERRLDQLIFPLLRPLGVDLELLLVVRAQKTWAKLHQESYLGYDKVYGGEAAYRRIRLFSGRLVS